MTVKRIGSESVATFGGQLASHVGRRVRVHLLDGRSVEGILADAPMVYQALGEGNELVLKGRLVLRSMRDPGRSDVYNIEEIGTYDVLPMPRTDPTRATG
jgi:hypothetical protein